MCIMIGVSVEGDGTLICGALYSTSVTLLDAENTEIYYY